jgi:hypothetical protein
VDKRVETVWVKKKCAKVRKNLALWNFLRLKPKNIEFFLFSLIFQTTIILYVLAKLKSQSQQLYRSHSIINFKTRLLRSRLILFKLQIGSWSYQSKVVKLLVEDKDVFLGDFYDSQEWLLVCF